MRMSVSGVLLAALCLLCAATSARAAVITGVGVSSLPGSSTGTIGPLGVTPSPSNDNAAGQSPNTIPYSIFFNSTGLLEVEFIAAASGGTTEYRFSQTFLNLTVHPWSTFSFELGFGTGADFVRSGALDGLDFDAPDGDPAPSASAFASVDQRSDSLFFSGGLVPFIGFLQFELRLTSRTGSTASRFARRRMASPPRCPSRQP